MTALLLVATALLIALNAFFVMGEYALVRSRRTRLEALRDEGARGATLALRQIDEIGDYISTVQVGITMTSIGIGALGEPVLAKVFEPLTGKVLGHGLAVALAVALAYLIITSAHIVAGELVPKLYAIDRAEGVARRVAPALRFFRRLFAPFIVVLTGISDRILRAIGVDPDRLTEEGSTPEDLKALIAQSMGGGTLDPGEAGMLSGVFHLHEQEARQVMTPIPAVVTVDTSEDVETALRRCISSGHTRLLVTEDENQDRVRGIVHSNSLARQLMAEGPHASIEPLVRDAPIVPETKPLDDLLADLQRQRSSMAVVVDEYGRVAGIVTVEDIVEEVVGEIADETDPAGGEIRRLANGDWFVRGHVAVTDLLDYGLELPVDTDAYNSVGGFVFAQLGRLPKRGDTITANGYSIRVESVRENRIEAVRIRERRAVATQQPGD
ncbi:MAG: magnesium and cobalt exporter, family [Solirubrobacteraceae bacterium]|jgi:CBS domain containing-hemolysin-like protein|nr:magnesium and cobalt exporter, family [Solirubrobacteraceae bacterium]